MGLLSLGHLLKGDHSRIQLLGFAAVAVSMGLAAVDAYLGGALPAELVLPLWTIALLVMLAAFVDSLRDRSETNAISPP